MSPRTSCIVLQKKSEFAKAEEYLIREGVKENAQLICALREAPERMDTQQVLMAKRGAEVRGVAWLNLAVGTLDWDFTALMETEDDTAITSLLNAMPKNAKGYFRMQRRMLREYMERLPGAVKGSTEVSYTTTETVFKPVDGDEVVELTREDAYLFEGCDSWTRHALGLIGIGRRRIFAIIKDGKVTTSAILGSILASPDRELCVAGIASLYTEERYRRMGLARRLVSYMTELALEDNKYVHYWTTPDNTASQALAESLGYWQYGTVVDYIWRTECIRSIP